MKSFIKRFVLFVISAVMCFACFACGNNGGGGGNNGGGNGGDIGGNEPTAEEIQRQVNDALTVLDDEEFTRSQLTGVDNLGREILPTVGFEDKYVGLFYFVATGYDYSNYWGGRPHDYIYDISELLKKYPATEYPITQSPVTAIPTGETAKYYDADIAPQSKSYFWGKPLYDYYRSDDEWVIRKHMELFMYAGIDFLYLDFTNNVTYEPTVKVLLNVIKDMIAEGYDAPKVTFFCNTEDPGGLSSIWGEHIYRPFFEKGEFDECWFRGDEEMNPSGNPILVGNFINFKNTEWEDEFCFIDEQWPTRPFNENSIPWMDMNYPQKIHTPWGNSYGGVTNVSVSQGGDASSEAYYADIAGTLSGYKARGYDLENFMSQGTDTEGVMSGVNFDYQWQTVHANADSLKMVTVTSWNEWIVSKLGRDDPASQGKDRACFVDQFSIAHSRDIEMTEGGYGDNYYMQMTDNIRKFKGVTVDKSDNVLKSQKAAGVSVTDLSVFDTARKYLDMGLSTVERNHTLVDRGTPVTDTTNRNDIEYIKILNDNDNLYVAVTCRDEIKMPDAGDSMPENWMNIYLQCGGEGWEGYDFIVRGNPALSGNADIVKPDANGNTVNAGNASFAVSGNTIVYSIPLSALGVSENKVIGIKATDNLQSVCNADEFMLHGDSAPMGRLNYAYKIA